MNAAAFKSLCNIRSNILDGCQRAFLDIKPRLVDSAHESMEQPKSGRTYIVYRSQNGRKLKRGRRHRASKKGESPAILSGRLYRSLSVTTKKGKILTFGSRSVEYARYLELGGRSFLMESINNNDRNIKREVCRGVHKAITGKVLSGGYF